MLKTLVRKQLMEVFRAYFYDTKNNKKLSRSAIIGKFVLFAAIIVGVLGGTFTYFSISLCGALSQAGMGWLYFILLSGIAILLGAFGSVFNTFSGLYLSKDNDLLLSMPIPVKYIIASRLLNVYLMGTLYSGVVILPAIIVNWIVTGPTVSNVFCGILLFGFVTIIVLVLSCLLGWCVAKVSLKLKRKSFATVLIALVLFGAYYFVYFKAQDLIQELVANAAVYGEKIKGSAYILYLFGRAGEGDWRAALIFAAVCAALMALTWLILKNTFLSIAISGSSGSAKKQYKEKTVKQRSAFGALLAKEFAKFTSSPNYMLNCGLGILLVPACGVLLLIKGPEIIGILEEVFGDSTGGVSILFCAALILLSSMNDVAAPSVSLEGKNIWIPQSLPVEAKTVLQAKMTVQLLLSGIPIAFTSVCAVSVMEAAAAVKVLVIITALLFAVFSALFSSVIGIKMPVLTWTNEIVPIKQSGAVLISILGGMCIAAVFAIVYFLIAYSLGEIVYLSIWAVLLAVLSLLLLLWLNTKGAKRFTEL